MTIALLTAAVDVDSHLVFLTLGSLLLIGLLADEIGRRTRLPRLTLMILFGIAAGPSVLDLLPAALRSWYDFLALAALTMVAFLLDGKLPPRHFGSMVAPFWPSP